MGVTIFFLALFIVPTWRVLKKDYKRGFFICLTFFFFMTNRLAIPGPFELTFQRILIVILAIYWMRWRRTQPVRVSPPFMGFMYFWLAMAIGSMVFTEVFAASVKWMISFSTEFVLFYVIVGTTIQDEEDVLKMWRALCISTGIIAVLGMIEYYRGFNPAIEWMNAYQEKEDEDVVVTFQHRILFGYAVAMAWPFLLVLAFRSEGKRKRWMLIGLAGCALADGYFSNSRGPWFGAAIGGMVMTVMGTKKIRKIMLGLAVMSVAVMIIRPGVRDTLYTLTMSTFEPDSYRGESYEYRKLLWPLAFKLIHESPVRLLFGCGPLALESMNLQAFLKVGGSATRTGWTSWDNNYAANLAEFGFLGFAAELLFYFAVVLSLVRLAFRCPPAYRDLCAGLLAASLVYLFSLSNVYMFSPQLKCIFLTLAVTTGRLVSLSRVASVQRHQSVGAQPAAAPAPG